MHSKDLIKTLKANGCYFVRFGKGDHQVWYSPKTKKTFALVHPERDVPIGTLLAIQKAAGLR